MAGCQTPHCAELLSTPDVIPLAREGTQSQSTDSSISHFIIGPLSHSKSCHCFGSVLWCCSFFLCKLVWSAILSSGLWRASYRNRQVVLSFRAKTNTLKMSTQAEMNSSWKYHGSNIWFNAGSIRRQRISIYTVVYQKTTRFNKSNQHFFSLLFNFGYNKSSQNYKVSSKYKNKQSFKFII